jgi:TrmH family RNA methyltransferase
MKHITSRQNPLVARYRAVAQGDDRTQLLLDGVHLVSDGLAAGLPIVHAVVTRDALEAPDVGALAASLGAAHVEVVSVAGPVMTAISPVRSASTIVALAGRRTLTEQDLFAPATPVIVCAVDVQDPGNLGAIARVAEAGGATGMAAAGHSADPFGWKALRGSMGSALRLPILARADTQRIVDAARRRGCRVIASVPRGGLPPERCRLDGPVLLLVGGEGAGLPPAVATAAEERVTIPMAAPVESLNTAVCAALLVYEARRQRLARASHGLAVSRQS